MPLRKKGQAPPAAAAGSAGARKKSPPKNSKSIALAAVGVVVAAAGACIAFVLRDGRSQPSGELSESILALLRCGEVCGRGYSDMDRMFAGKAAADLGEPIELHLGKACLWRCGKAEKEAPVAPGSFAPSKAFWDYRGAALKCIAEAKASSNKFGGGQEAAERLRRCGVVHLPGLLGTPDALPGQLRQAWQDLRKESTELAKRVDMSRLRNDRWEVWLPFEAPFNDTQLLASDALLDVLAKYWPEDPESVILDHVTVINVLDGKPAQPLHSDVRDPTAHLELHVPLVEVTAALGPTRFCPCTQHLGDTEASAAERESGVEMPPSLAPGGWRFVSPAKLCEAEPSLGYVLDALPVGGASIYDAAVVHGGGATELRGGASGMRRERPVLQLSFAASAEVAGRRGYLEKGFADGSPAEAAASQAVASADTALFRDAFVQARKAAAERKQR